MGRAAGRGFAAGFGVVPKAGGAVDWALLRAPMIVPYLGMETVVGDAALRECLLSILCGQFIRCFVGDLQRTTRCSFLEQGYYAVPIESLRSSNVQPELPADTEVLQVSCASGSCYLLAKQVQALLNIDGKRSYLFDLLCAHSAQQHTDRHLGTHIAVLRREEGEFRNAHVIINAHPAFEEPLAMAGMINEPMPLQAPTMKMIEGHARPLMPMDPRLVDLGVEQQSSAIRAWKKYIMPPSGAASPLLTSERMVMYVTTRRSYSCTSELTVDYGPAYIRDYASGQHQPARAFSLKPLEQLSNEQINGACWPTLPGWFNPKQQPMNRPAFAVSSLKVNLCTDDPELVVRRRFALACPYLTSKQLHTRSFGSSFAALTDPALSCCAANRLKRPLASITDGDDSGADVNSGACGISEGAATVVSLSNFSDWASGEAELTGFQQARRWADGEPIGRGHGSVMCGRELGRGFLAADSTCGSSK